MFILKKCIGIYKNKINVYHLNFNINIVMKLRLFVCDAYYIVCFHLKFDFHEKKSLLMNNTDYKIIIHSKHTKLLESI